jgi:hypothetical protein
MDLMRKTIYYLLALLAVVSFMILTFFTAFVRVDFTFMEETTLIIGGFFGLILIFIVGGKNSEVTKQ